MFTTNEILETIKMIDEDCLDVRTITMGISLIDCMDENIDRSCEKIYRKITRLAKDLVKVGEAIEKEYGIPIINKRISVTPIAMLAGASGGDPLQPDLGGFDALYDADQGAGAKSRTDGVGEAVYALRTENIGAGG